MPAPYIQKARIAGFTLLEMIVTLLLVSLLVMTLMQMLAHALGVRTRLLHYQEATRVSYLHEGWFRDVASAVQLDDSDGAAFFHGKPHELTLVSAMPLQGHGLARVRWMLEESPTGEVSLRYVEGDGEPITILPGPLEEAGFSYLDADSGWQDEWKSPTSEQMLNNRIRPLPALVRFTAQTDNGEQLWLVPFAVNRSLPKLSDLGVGSGAEAEGL